MEETFTEKMSTTNKTIMNAVLLKRMKEKDEGQVLAIKDDQSKDACLKKLESLLEQSPVRNKHSVPSIWLQDYNHTSKNCDIVFPYMKKMKEHLYGEGLSMFNDTMTETVETERVSHYIVDNHGKEMDKGLKKELLLNKPFTYLAHYMLR